MDPEWRCISYIFPIKHGDYIQPAMLVYWEGIPSTKPIQTLPPQLCRVAALQGSGWFVASTILDNPGPGPDITKPIEFRPCTGQVGEGASCIRGKRMNKHQGSPRKPVVWKWGFCWSYTNGRFQKFLACNACFFFLLHLAELSSFGVMSFARVSHQPAGVIQFVFDNVWAPICPLRLQV